MRWKCFKYFSLDYLCSEKITLDRISNVHFCQIPNNVNKLPTYCAGGCQHSTSYQLHGWIGTRSLSYKFQSLNSPVQPFPCKEKKKEEIKSNLSQPANVKERSHRQVFHDKILELQDVLWEGASGIFCCTVHFKNVIFGSPVLKNPLAKRIHKKKALKNL